MMEASYRGEEREGGRRREPKLFVWGGGRGEHATDRSSKFSSDPIHAFELRSAGRKEKNGGGYN